MSTHIVNVLAPGLDLSAGALDVEKPMLVEAHQSDTAIESRDIGIFGRHAPAVHPQGAA